MKKFDFVIIFLFIAISGNPFICQWSWAAIFLLFVFLSYLVLREKSILILRGIIVEKNYLLAFCTLFMLQLIVCADISIITQINYLFKILLAGLIYLYYGERFKYLYLNVISFVAVVSLVLYLAIMLGWTFESPFGTGFYKSSSLHTLLIFNYNTEFNPDRNAGMFWEPGCFACYLCLVPLFFIHNPQELLNKYKFRALILFLALLSTQSTTGILTLAVILLFISIRSWQSFAKFFFICCLMILYFNDVVIEKLTRDFGTVDGLTFGEYVNYDGYNTENRLGTIFFLAPLIMLHPVVGNGLNPEAFYSSMREMLNLEHIGLGNGFFTYWASLGLLGLFIFFGGIIKYWKLPLKQRVISIIILILLLQGEPLLIYPLVMGLPFLKHRNHVGNISQQ